MYICNINSRNEFISQYLSMVRRSISDLRFVDYADLYLEFSNRIGVDTSPLYEVVSMKISLRMSIRYDASIVNLRLPG